MEIKATHRFARISPLKARDVAREMKGLPVSEALEMVQFTPKKAAYLVGKVLKSAIANAENNHDLSAENLIVKSATVGEGPTFRRFNPRARGGAAPIRKRTSHIYVVLTDEVGAREAQPEPAVEEAAETETRKPVAKKKTAAAGPKKAKEKTAGEGEAESAAGSGTQE